MPHVTMLSTAAGADLLLEQGKTYNLPPETAAALIAGGYAKSAEPAPVAAPLEAEPAVETEKATAKTRKEKR